MTITIVNCGCQMNDDNCNVLVPPTGLWHRPPLQTRTHDILGIRKAHVHHVRCSEWLIIKNAAAHINLYLIRFISHSQNRAITEYDFGDEDSEEHFVLCFNMM